MTRRAEREHPDAAPAPGHAIVDLTQAGIVTGWNAAAEFLYGYPEEEAVGLSVDVLRPERGRAEQTDVLHRVAATGRARRHEVELVRKDGTTVIVSMILTPINGPAGGIVGISEVSWEVDGEQGARGQTAETIGSERRDARDVQERTDTQRREARDAQDRIDVRADTQRRDARDVQDRIDVRVGAQRRDARDAQDQAEAVQDSERRDAEDLFDARRDDERRETLAQNVGLQAQVSQIQRMDSLGQLAGGVAHDFNNFLAIILSYASFVSHSLAVAAASSEDGRWDEARADMDHIQRTVERAAALTRQLLAFSSREAIRPLALDINEVITGVEELLRRAVGEHIQLATSLADGLWPVLADSGKLEQVLVNLAVNARDAMPGGGTLTVTTANVNPAGVEPKADQGRRVQLRVSDTGTGMAADVIERAFEPFFTTKAEGRGTGLGLATVYGIVTQAGGDIQISSRPGLGTTFAITLPVTDEAAAPAGEPPSSDWEPHAETVLVIEDDDDLRVATGRIFARAGYQVLVAAGAAEALEIARTHDGQIHLLATDIVMPHMLGTEAAQKIQATRPEMAVLYLSGYVGTALAAQSALDPDMVLVQKPFSDADLLAQAGQALSGHSRRLKAGEQPAP